MVVSTLTECFSGKSALAEFTYGECNPFPTGGQCPRDSTDDYQLLSVESLCSPSYHPCCQRLARILVLSAKRYNACPYQSTQSGRNLWLPRPAKRLDP